MTPARRPPAGLVAVGLLVAGVMALPVAHLALRAAEAEDPAAVLGRARVGSAVASTVLLAVTVTAASATLGVALAWLLERTDLPGRRLLGAWAALPLVVPTYVAAVALKDAFGPNALVVEVPGIVGFSGAAASLTLSTFPYVLLLVRAALASGDPALEEAARSLGDDRRRVLWRVVLPQLRPALAAGSLLVFLYVLSDFGAVTILRYETITLRIFAEYRTSFDRAPAALLGLVLVGLTVAAILLERLLRGRGAAARMVAGSRPPPRRPLGPWRWPAVALVLAVGALGTGVPVLVLAYRTFIARSRVLDPDIVVRAAGTSIGLAVAAAIVAVTLAVPVATLGARFRSRFTSTVESLSSAGYALPGLVIALALVFFAANYLPGLYQTASLVVVAYVIRFFPEALGAARSGLVGLDPAVEEAARSLGDGRLSVARRVTVPLIRRSLVGGGLLVFLTSMKELPATLLLRPAGVDTLATRVWTGAAEGRFAQAAPAALVLVLLSGLALSLLRDDRAGSTASPLS
ncbi:MAG TPA: iron ABC transporter permease [Acidimicrobiales bacterium]|nr:iron ABC transporter permease [Acidimicrobiales bacterium]